jgi:uncharacterized protein
MSQETIDVSLESARRLAVSNQHLSGKLTARPGARAILSVVRDLTHVQWDPITVVAPSHILSLWSRLGDFRPSELEKLLWNEKKLFLHWTPIASIVLTEDYPLYRSLMSRFPDSMSSSWGAQRQRAKRFLVTHRKLREQILGELRKGPLRQGDFQIPTRTRKDESGWSFGSDLSLMLFYLLMSGEVMVVGHEGNQNLWGLSEQFLPSWVDTRTLSEADQERESALRAIRALGTATPREINYYFPRGRYQDLAGTLLRLREEGAIHRVQVEGLGPRDERYVHRQDLRSLQSKSSAAWQPRVSLLPPFDTMIGNIERTKRLFGFEYVREQFLPREKRRFGTYVLPILWGEKFIGRIDPRMDKERGELHINAVHAEPQAPADRETADQIRETIARLGKFLDARRVIYSSRVPEIWKRSLQ